MANIAGIPAAKSRAFGHKAQKYAGAAKTEFSSFLLTECTQILLLLFRAAEMAQGQHGHLCQDLCTCQILPVFKFTPCSSVDLRPLHFPEQNTHHQKWYETSFLCD
jgi:hypothetical protein